VTPHAYIHLAPNQKSQSISLCILSNTRALAISSALFHRYRPEIAWVIRDAMLPALWVQAWLSDGFEWRGNDVHVDAGKMQPT
jgi:hypothetical protein